MKRERLKALPPYPEERRCAHPTTEQALRRFSHAERHLLSRGGRVVQSFDADFTPPQHQSTAAPRRAGERLPRLTARRKFPEITSAMCGK